jgi:hypothetical protein
MGDDGTPSARLHWGIENNGGEVMIRDHQVNYSEASPGTIENQTAQTPFVMGASYNGGDTTSTTTNLYSVWGNGKRTALRTPSVSMQTNDQLGLRLNGSNYDTADWTGKIGEHIIYPWELTGIQRQKVDTYLAIKYGTTMIGGEMSLSLNSTNGAGLTSIGQVFTASVTGGVNSITLQTGGSVNGSTGTLYMCTGSVSLTNCINNVGSVQMQTPQALTTIPTTINTTFTIPLTTPAEVTAGNQYTLVIASGANVFYRTMSTDSYLGGNRVGFGTEDLYFSVNIAPDMISSSGATIWSYDSYNNNVTAIARDDASALNQLSSTSTSNSTFAGSQGIVTISKASLANGDYLVIGDNTSNGFYPTQTLLDNYTTWLTDASIPAGYMRPGKSGNFIEWRTREVGTAANNYTLSVNLENSSRNLPDVTALNNTLYVLFDSNSNGSLSDEVLNTGILPMSDDGSTLGDTVAGDKIYTINNLALDDTDKFTFVQTTLPTPGAYSTGITGWYKANEGVFSDTSGTTVPANAAFVARWNDFSGNSNTMTQSNTSFRPYYYSDTSTGSINFNPTVNFNDGGNDNFLTLAGTASLFANSQPARVFAVGTRNTLSGTWNTLLQQGSGNSNDPMMGVYDNYLYQHDGGQRSNANPYQIPGTATGFMFGFNWATTGAGTTTFGSINGANQSMGAAYDNTFGSGPTQISESTSGENWDGNLAEIITYQAAPSAAEVQRVESYLAMKYGITLSKSIDQNLVFDSNLTGNTSVGQTFTASATGQIGTITLQTGTTVNANTGTLYICNGASASTTSCISSPAYTQAVTIPTTTTTVFSIPLTTPFDVTSGSSYSFVLVASTGNANLKYYSAGTNYTGGTILYTSGTATQDLYFKVDYLAQDYVLSNGTSKTWTALNNAYNRGITVIARDDASDLDQRKSKAVNLASVWTLGNGNSLSSPSAFAADLSGMSIAHQGGVANVWTNTGAPTGKQIIARAWKVETTGTVGTVTLAIDTQNTDNSNEADIPTVSSANGILYLITDADGNFVAGSTATPMYDDGTNGDVTSGDKVYTVNNLTLATGSYFTVGQNTPPAPGGISTGIKAWWKADAGVYSDAGATTVPANAGPVLRWLDQSGNNKTLVSTGNNPDYRLGTDSQAINFNPTINYENGHSDGMQVSSAIGGVLGGDTYNDLHVYTVQLNDSTTSSGEGFMQNSMTNGAGRFGFYGSVQGGSNHYISGTSNQATNASSSGFVVGSPYIYHMYNKTTGPDELGLVRNGKTAIIYPIASPLTAGNGTACVGGSCQDYGDQKFAEAIVYAGDNSVGTINQQIESYLALKYGLTMDQTIPYSYLASDGTTMMWNSDSNLTEATYINDIFGIGRDDASGLLQLKSKSQQQNGYGFITLSTSSGTIPTDKAFMTIADNGGTATFGTAQAPTGYQIIGKRFQVQEPGADVGNVTLQVDVNDSQFNIANASNFYLMIDTDSDGTYFDENVAGGGIYPLYDDGTNGDVTAGDSVWSLNNIDFQTAATDQARFTIGTRVQGPGGVTTGLVLWLNAGDVDADGLTNDNPADGANMQQNIVGGFTSNGSYWTDRSVGANNITNVPSNGYIYESDATNQALFGGNPFLRANNSSAYMNIATNASLKSGTAYFMYQETNSNTNLDFIATSFSNDLGLYQMLGTSNASFGQYMGLVTNVGNDSTQTNDNRYGGTVVDTYTNEPAIAMYDRPTDGDEIMIAEYQRTKTGTPTREQNVFGVQGNSMLPFGYFGNNPGVQLFGGEYTTAPRFDYGEIIYYGCTTTGCAGGKSAAEKLKIESYLSMKYGTTMRDTSGNAIDYKSSANTTVWNATTANLHKYRIAFIGQDDASAWEKTTSAIIDFNTNEILKLTNPSDLEDQEFASIADDNGQKATASSSNSPSGFSQRLVRTWKYQTVGGDGVGTVDLQFNLNNQTALASNSPALQYKVLFDADGDFTSGATISNIVPTVSAGFVTFPSVPMSDLTNGTYIAIGNPGASLTYSAETWTEASANNGTIDVTTPVTITLTNDTFPAAVVNGTNLTAGVHYSTVGLPGGLALNLRKDSSTQLTVLITGAASSHLNANDVNNFQILFTNAAFTSAALAAYVVDYDKDDLVFDFSDPNSAVIEFSSASASSTNEATANNFPTILVNGILATDQSVNVAVLSGGAIGSGVDYTFGTLDVLNVTIPAGTYDGTTATDIVITVPVLNNDTLGEAGGETMVLGFTNPTSSLATGDANGDTTTQSSHTYTITDDDKSLNYTSNTVAEAAANNGTITATYPIVLSGATFATVGVLTNNTHYTRANVPAGLSMVITTTSTTTGTVSFTGSATAHANANDVSNLTITFLDAAFTGGQASTIAGYTKNNLIIDFIEQTMSYIGTGFTEISTNNGGVTGSITASLTGATFINPNGTLAVGVDVTLGNVPAGLTPAVAVDVTGTLATLTLSGTAATHTNAVDVANITFAFADSAFTGGTLAANVGNATGPANSNLGVNFNDVTLTYGTTTFDEVIANNGSTTTTSSLTLAGDTFRISVGNFTSGVDYNVSNLPAGMTMVITATSATTATVSITGNATDHTSAFDVANLTITWLNTGFNVTPAANITNSTKSDFVIDFDDAASIVYAGSFAETNANTGAVSGSRTATLTGDVFQDIDADNVLDVGTEVIIANVPAGLAASVALSAGDTVATLTLSGSATVHTNAADIANLSISFTNSAFVNTALATGVTGYTDATGIVDFKEVSITYSAGSFTEAAALDGSIGNTVTVTLAGDTFTSGSGTMTGGGVDYTETNVPSGLTMVVTRTSTTTATISFTGTAASHTNGDDIANLGIAFTNNPFTATPASGITNSTKTDFIVDFGDATIAYTGAGFTETSANTGAVTGSIIATLTDGGAPAFINPSGTLTVGVDVTLGNVPAGLTPTVSIDGTGQIATLTLAGTAATHTNAVDVSDITFTFADSAFTGITAAVIAGATGPASSALGVDFKDVALAYATTTFVENITNNGTISTTSAITLTGDTFVLGAGNFTQGVHYNVTNLGAGLTMNIAANSTTTATVSITGTAAAHANANDVSNLTITWLDAAFTATPAANVTNFGKNDFVVDFADAGVITWTGSYSETGANIGAVTGSRIGTLVGDTFITGILNGTAMALTTHYTVNNLPAGLTAVVTKTSPTVATVTLIGNATSHANANDVSNFGITFVDGVFTSTLPASGITGYTDSTGVIDYMDQPGIIYAGNFVETVTNTGLVTGSSRTATLSGDTFVNAGGTLTEGVHFSLANKPAGFTAVMNVNGGGTVATLTFTGNATAHANINDVSNLTITFLDGAFTTTATASSITGYTDATGIVNFSDVGLGSVTYSTGTFTESALNNGTIGNSITLTLSGDSWAAAPALGVDVVVANVPAGLTASLVRTSNVVLTLSLTGTAASSTNANDIANLSVTLNDGAFNALTAATVTNAVKSDIVVDFFDVALAYTSSTFDESLANNGSTTSTAPVTLTGDTFTISTNGAQFTSGFHYSVANLPIGMTMVITANSATTATVSITGNASSHSNAFDVSNLTITWLNPAFTGAAASTVTNYVKNNFVVNFIDQASIAYAGNFTEVAGNTGSVVGSSRTATITGDTFQDVNADDLMDYGVEYTLTNAPAGLTPVLTLSTGDTVATLTFTGTATTHTNAVDVSALTITFLNGAFTNTTTATNVTGFSNAAGVIDFIDISMSYSGGTFSEASTLNGAIGNTVTVTLTGDTFTASSGVMSGGGVDYTASNVPSGLTMVVTRTSATTAEISFTGTAASHANANDIANLGITFASATFTNALAANITDSAKTNFIVDFGDAIIAYTGTGFTENVANNGSVTGSITATLTTGGPTFINAGGNLLVNTDVTLGNVPAGLTPVVAIDGTGLIATITLTGNAATHTNAVDVSDITFVFADSAFTGGLLAADTAGATGPASSSIGVDFFDVNLAYATTTFPEVIANNGTTSTTSALTLTGGAFVNSSGALTQGIHYNVTNLPAGMTMSITLSSNTAGTVAITGAASSHANVDDVSNLTITFLDAAFASGVLAANVGNANKNDFVVDFDNQASITWASNFSENLLNDGTVTGSRTATLAGDTFIVGIANGNPMTAGVHYTTNIGTVAPGLTAVVTKTSPTVATITITGTAASHQNANDVSNLTFTFLDGVFTTTTSASNVTNFSDATGVIDYADQASIIYSGNFTEHISGNGTVTGSRASILTGDTFVTGSLTENTHFTIGNKPAGLTAVMTRTSATIATLTFTGTAASHTNLDDVSNLTITWLDGAFTNTALTSNITNPSDTVGVIDFIEVGSGTITYDGSTFTESTSNNGTIGNVLTLTLTTDIWAPTLAVGTNVTVNNLPAGLTANITRVSNTVATLGLAGNATSHINAADIANLEVVFADAAFNALPAAQIANATKSDIVINFSDNATAVLTYSAGTFTESVANNGTITNSVTVTISGGATFGASLTAGVDVTFTNVPAGLTATITRTSATTATIGFTGSAAAHLNANDIANFTATWADSAFIGVLAADTTGTGVKSDFIVDFADQASIVYGGAGFTESTTNDGTVTGSITATLTGDTFVTPLGQPLHATIGNVPAGMTAVLTRTSATVATLTLTGSATAHANINDVANLSITWQDGAFTNTTLATNVTDNTYTTGVINFADVTLSYGTTTFAEVLANDGTTSTTSAVTLAGDTFVLALGNFTQGVHYNVTNLPAGMSMNIAATSSTTATVSITGTAAAHANANDVSNLTITWLTAAFTNTNPVSTIVDYAKNDFVVDFADQPSIIYAGSFIETNSNTGSLVGTNRTATLTGDTFVNAGGTLTEGVHFSLTNKPAGLTAVMSVNGGGTVATLTFTGTATAHANANDVSNLTITFLNGAFTNTPLVANVTSASNALGLIDFGEAFVAYTGAGFTETTANAGAVSGSIIVTLTGDTWSAGLSATDVTLANVPAGLTPVLTRTSATVATLTLTGSAAAHADINDVADITFVFADTAFTTFPAATIAGGTGPASSSRGVNFSDIALSYGTTTFTESAANDGSTSTTSAVTLTGDTFVLSTTGALFTSGVHYSAGNVPAGMTLVITAVDATHATVSLTGSASANLTNPADVTNLTITWADAAFTATAAANITNFAKNDFVFDFTDQASILYAGGFTEVLANDGSVTGSRTATLTGDTYTAGVVNGSPFTQATHYTVSGVPTGLTAVVTKTSGTVATITLTGNATSHADTNDIANLSITWLGAAFTNTPVNTNVTNYTDATGVVDFTDQASIVYSGNFTESILDDGSVTGSRLSILSGDTFHVGALVEGVDFDLTNKPAGLTAVMTRSSANLATLTFTGNAAVSHQRSRRLSTRHNLERWCVLSTTPLATNVTDYTDATGTIDFIEPGTGSITYDSSTFTESSANNGAIGNVLTLTLSGATYVPALAVGTNVTVTNVPTGLTATITRISPTVATLNLTGNANSHVNANDIANLTVVFADGAFSGLTASQITNFNKTNIVVDFSDNSTANTHVFCIDLHRKFCEQRYDWKLSDRHHLWWRYLCGNTSNTYKCVIHKHTSRIDPDYHENISNNSSHRIHRFCYHTPLCK